MSGQNMDSYGILFDVERCIGCNACAMACKAEFGWPEGHFIVRVDPFERGIFPKVEKNFIRKACMHCSEAACMMACPVEAITRRLNGTIFLDEKKCIGCQYCVVNCPFSVPQYNTRLGKSFKCNLCEHRTAVGKEPACVSTCITGALRYGRIEDMKALGMKILNTKGIQKALYGESFLQGTHVLYAVKGEPEHYGLQRDPKVPLSVVIWKRIIQPLGTFGIIGAILAAMVHYLLIGPKKEKVEVKHNE